MSSKIDGQEEEGRTQLFMNRPEKAGTPGRFFEVKGVPPALMTENCLLTTASLLSATILLSPFPARHAP
jgi:hypothetical protein